MSATAAEPITEPATDTATIEPAADTAAATDSASELEKWKALARKHEARAKENKTAAEELAAIREAQKSDAEKAAERLAAAEKKAVDLELKVLRADVAQAKGVPAGLLSGSTEDELNAAADALLAFRGKPASAPPAAGTQGNTGTPIGAGTVSEQLHQQIDAATKAGRHAEAISLKRQLSALNNKTT